MPRYSLAQLKQTLLQTQRIDLLDLIARLQNDSPSLLLPSLLLATCGSGAGVSLVVCR